MMIKKVILLAWLVSFATLASVKSITPKEVVENQHSEEPYIIVDVRSEEEYLDGHLKGAINIPFNQLDKFESELQALSGKTVVVYCRSGRRAGIFMDATKDRSVNYLHLEGDYLGWLEHNLPVAKPE